MKKLFLWLLLSGIVLAILMGGCSKQPQKITGPQTQQAPLFNRTPGAEYIPGSYIVVMKESVADVDKDVDEIGQRYTLKADFRYKHALKGFAGKLSAAVVEALRNDPRVAYIEQDQIAHMDATQINPTWGLDRIDQRALPLDNSYTYNQSGAGVDVYCLDTGIRLTHVDFGGRAVTGYDAITPGGTAADGNGHGTHTAGTIGGATYGVAKAVRLIAVCVLDSTGQGTYAQVIAGVDWVTGDHTTTPAVANMSLGGPLDAALDQAVRNSIADGVTYCVSAGNSSADASTQSPADVGEALTVGATNSSDAFAYFSNFGSIVDVQAPGVNVTSDYYTSNTATTTMSGTSMAAPHVAGAAALYLEANPTATPAAVHDAIIGNATTGVITGLPMGTANRLLYSIISTTPPVVPAPPVLSSPANGATGVTLPVALSWNASFGATSYRVQVSTSSAFTTTVYDHAGISSTSVSVSGLAPSTLYYWRVNATNAAGTSNWSTVRNFTTGTGMGPAAPTLVSPANGANNVPRSPTLTWNASSGATSYRVQVCWDPSFNTNVYDRSGITSTSTVVTGLAGKTLHYWRVNATNANGTSKWSTTWSFTTRK
jgi:subtilisin family serine protease